MIRAGTCSVCRCALESPDGGLERVRARSVAIRRQLGGHHHVKPWSVVPDGDTVAHGDRAWHDLVPEFVS